MTEHILTGSLIGLDAELVEVEADARFTQSKFFIVGLPDAMMQEARERVKSATKHSCIAFPRGTVVVNLAPADLRKAGTLYDLPIAVAIASIDEHLEHDRLASTLIAGELALDGSLRPIHGVLSLAALAKRKGLASLIIPKENAKEAALIHGVRVYGAESLIDVITYLKGEDILEIEESRSLTPADQKESAFDFSAVRGQEKAKRALEIAAAGAHNVLMQGPPGSGKTMLAQCYASILPPMTAGEILEATRVWSIAGKLDAREGILSQRPFRAPHHTASGVSLVGGGANPRPGEISLAHRGVLFLDEFPEFPRPVLENLRQPLEDGIVTVTRVQQSVTYPARFNLIAAMNPCPCGYATDKDRACTCSPLQISSYRKRLSGPLLDRIDIKIEVPKVPTEKLMQYAPGESSAEIRERILHARQKQQDRFEQTGVITNSELSSQRIRDLVVLEGESVLLMEQAVRRHKLSARSYFRVLKVARTIADLDGEDLVSQDHLAEALQFRQIEDG